MTEFWDKPAEKSGKVLAAFLEGLPLVYPLNNISLVVNAHKGVHNLPRLKEIIRLSTPFLKAHKTKKFCIIFFTLNYLQIRLVNFNTVCTSCPDNSHL